jgi:hypothetical protein
LNSAYCCNRKALHKTNKQTNRSSLNPSWLSVASVPVGRSILTQVLGEKYRVSINNNQLLNAIGHCRSIALHEPLIDNVIWGGLVNKDGVGMGTVVVVKPACDVATPHTTLSTFQFASINRDQSRRVDYWEMKFT